MATFLELYQAMQQAEQAEESAREAFQQASDLSATRREEYLIATGVARDARNELIAALRQANVAVQVNATTVAVLKERPEPHVAFVSTVPPSTPVPPLDEPEEGRKA